MSLLQDSHSIPLPTPAHTARIQAVLHHLSRNSTCTGPSLLLGPKHVALRSHLVQGGQACRLNACDRTCRTQTHVFISHCHRLQRTREHKRHSGSDTHLLVAMESFLKPTPVCQTWSPIPGCPCPCLRTSANNQCLP